MIKVTLDTNILVSGSFWTGDSFRILELIDKEQIFCILSKDILEEYYETIKSEEIIDKIENKNLILSKISQNIISNATIVVPTEKLAIVKDDPDDNIILECAVAGQVNYAITNDQHLLKLKEFRGIKILTPKEFIKIIK